MSNQMGMHSMYIVKEPSVIFSHVSYTPGLAYCVFYVSQGFGWRVAYWDFSLVYSWTQQDIKCCSRQFLYVFSICECVFGLVITVNQSFWPQGRRSRCLCKETDGWTIRFPAFFNGTGLSFGFLQLKLLSVWCFPALMYDGSYILFRFKRTCVGF